MGFPRTADSVTTTSGCRLVPGEAQAHRAQQKPGEAAYAAAAHHDGDGLDGLRGQYLGGVAVEQLGAHVNVATVIGRQCGGLHQHPLTFLAGRVVKRALIGLPAVDGRRHDMDDPQVACALSRVVGRPQHRCQRCSGAVHTHDDRFGHCLQPLLQMSSSLPALSAGPIMSGSAGRPETRHGAGARWHRPAAEPPSTR